VLVKTEEGHLEGLNGYRTRRERERLKDYQTRQADLYKNLKEQQKRCLKSEFRNTHFSYTLGVEGVEQFVSTPELHSDTAIDGDPLPRGRS
jgi:hypothetical protein